MNYTKLPSDRGVADENISDATSFTISAVAEVVKEATNETKKTG